MMRDQRQSLCCAHRLLPIAALLLSATTGCLSLGGRTTYVQEKPETEGRLRALEVRVNALESAFTTRQSIMPSLPAGTAVETDTYGPIPASPDGS